MKNAGQLTFSGHVKGTTVELNNSGMCQVNSTFDLTDSYTCKTSGLSNNDGDVTARTISIFNSGQEQRKGTLKADRLTIDVDGNSQYAMSLSVMMQSFIAVAVVILILRSTVKALT